MADWYDDWQHEQHAVDFDRGSGLDLRNLIRNYESFNDVRLLNESLDPSPRPAPFASQSEARGARSGCRPTGVVVQGATGLPGGLHRQRPLTLLEVGCATGEFYRYLRARHPHVRYHGTDISQPAIARAKAKYPAAPFFVTDPAARLRDALRGLGITERPDIVYSKDVVHHQTRPFEFLSDLIEVASDLLIIRTRTRDMGETELDPERSCQYHYDGWMPFIVLNLQELVERITTEVPAGEIVVYRNHMVLGGRHNRFLPKELYLKETGTAETAIGIFKTTTQPSRVTVKDWTDMNPSYSWDYLLRHAARQAWDALRPPRAASPSIAQLPQSMAQPQPVHSNVAAQNFSDEQRSRLNGPLTAFRALQKTGVGVLDVGARGGIRPIFRSVAPLLDVVGFEPDPSEAQRLLQEAKASLRFQSLTYLPVALGKTSGEHVLYLCRSRGASAFSKPNRAFLNRFPDAGRYDVMGTASVPVRSLDSLVSDPSVRLPRSIDFIKMDTQGSELEILQGASELLRTQVVAIEVEVLFARLYESQPVFRDVDAWLSERGFSLFKLRRQELVRNPYATRPHISAGQLAFGDALYLRDPLDPPRPWIPQDARQLEALILLAMLYDLHDFALELILAPQFAKMLDVERLRRCVERRSRRLGSLRERLRVAKVRCFSGDGMTRYATRWARGDNNFYSVL